MKKTICFVLATLCALSFAGCGFKERAVKAQNLAATVAAREVQAKTADNDFKASYNDFSLKLLNALYSGEQKDNACISPLSIAAAFGMITNGATGETKAQLETALGGSAQSLNEYFAAFIKETAATETVNIANSIWSKKNEINVSDSFLDIVKNYYQADYYVADFNGDTLNDINNWIYNNTRGGIEKALDQISPETVIYLINALDFEAEWSDRFKKQFTKDQVFHGTKGDKTVKMMRSAEHSYIGTDKASGFVKYYKDGYYFAGLLPDDGYTVTDVIADLTGEKLNDALSNKHYTQINLSLPKFDFECDYNLNNAFKALGASVPFDVNNADFSDLGELESGKNIYISNAIHKTHITVDEEKTKASAVTIIDGAGAAAPPQEKIDLVFDRPFVFMICNKNNLPLFIGVTENV